MKTQLTFTVNLTRELTPEEQGDLVDMLATQIETLDTSASYGGKVGWEFGTNKLVMQEPVDVEVLAAALRSFREQHGLEQRKD